MSKQCLDIHQMKHLKELGLDTSKASMCWCTFNGDTTLSVHDEYCYESASLHQIPTFTLQDILDLLPKVILNDKYKGKLCIEYNEHNNEWIMSYKELSVIVFYSHDENLIDAAYEMLCWCIENGYVKTNKED